MKMGVPGVIKDPAKKRARLQERISLATRDLGQAEKNSNERRNAYNRLKRAEKELEAFEFKMLHTDIKK